MTLPDRNLPRLVITADEIADATAPFVVAYNGQVIRLRSATSLSLDDLEPVMETAETNVRDALLLLVADDDSRQWVTSTPLKFLLRVFRVWRDDLDLAPGESGGSEKSSEPTGQQ